MFELFEHKADVGVRGFGKTLEEAFQECAKAMFGVMADLSKVKAKESVEVHIEARNEEELLLGWLNELLFEKGAREMLFSDFKVKIAKGKESWALQGTAKGEKMNPEKHGMKTEVKGASYSGLKVVKEKGKFLAQCIVDV
ncbi:MAG: archease [Candidatus Diapherotrites archaeon]|nr:archease [Candidatus Diapherotrites archaeon]